MVTVRRQLRHVVWLALVLMLAMVAWPTISRAMTPSLIAPTGWAEVCTFGGVQWVAPDSAGSGDGVPATNTPHAQDCPYCRLTSMSGALPAAEWSIGALPAATTTAPPLSLHVPHAVRPWADAQPRAPPSRS